MSKSASAGSAATGLRCMSGQTRALAELPPAQAIRDSRGADNAGLSHTVGRIGAAVCRASLRPIRGDDRENSELGSRHTLPNWRNTMRSILVLTIGLSLFAVMSATSAQEPPARSICPKGYAPLAGFCISSANGDIVLPIIKTARQKGAGR